MACNCNEEGKIINIGMGCCVPVVANADAYYTKSEIDEKIDEIVTSGCCITPEEVDEKISAATDGYATEQWVLDQNYISGVDLSDYALKSEIPTVPTNVSAFNNDAGYLTQHQSLSGYATEQWVDSQGYLTEHQPLKTINGETLVGTGNIVISSSTTDLSNYYNKQEVDVMVDDMATKTWVLNQNYVTNSELIQYIQNLQNQITQLQIEVSGCCSGGGSTQTRWLTMTGDNDYVCSGTTKYTKEKEQTSTDGVNWTDTGNYRQGSVVLEENSVACGYVDVYKFKGVLRNSNVVEVPCNSSTTLTEAEVHNTKGYKSIEIGDCVTEIGDEAFQLQIDLDSIVIPSGVTTIGEAAFADAGNSTSSSAFTITLNEGLEVISKDAFFGCRNYSALTIPNSVTTIGDAAFTNNNASVLTIGSGITSIGRDAFGKPSGNTQYTSVTVLATVPPELGAFNFDGEFPIYVLAASVNAYKTAQRWSGYADRILPIV